MILLDRRPIRAMRLARVLAADPEFEVMETVVSFAQVLRSEHLSQTHLVVVAGSMPEDAQKVAPRILHLPEDELEQSRIAGEYADIVPRVLERMRGGMQAAPAGAAPAQLPLVCIGASTGGLTVLQQILESFPEDCPPTLIVQHIRGSFSAGVAERMNRLCRAHVAEATSGAPVVRGRIYLAPGDQYHLELRNQPNPHCKLVAKDKVTGHRPSVDALFHSVAAGVTPGVAVLLTGMGRDGAEGLLRLRRAGWHTIVQDEETSTVFGMPRVALELGAAEEVLPDRMIGNAILRACSKMAQRQVARTT